MYHVEGLTQNDVAQRLNINRMMMVRLLADNGLIIMELDVSELMMVSGGINILTVAFGKKPAS